MITANENVKKMKLDTAVESSSILLKVKLLSEKGKLPTRGSVLAAGYDLYRFI